MTYIIVAIAVFILLVENYSMHLPHSFNDVGTLNAFPDCLTRVINFNGLNIDFRIISHPIVLLRYFTFIGVDNLYPFELKSSKAQTFLEWVSKMNVSRFKKKGFLSTNNNALQFYNPLALDWFRLTVTDQFNMMARNQNCEANIYWNPRNQYQARNLYRKQVYYGIALKKNIYTKLRV